MSTQPTSTFYIDPAVKIKEEKVYAYNGTYDPTAVIPGWGYKVIRHLPVPPKDMVERLRNSPVPENNGYFAGMNGLVIPQSAELTWDGKKFTAADQAGVSYTQATNPGVPVDQLPEEDEFAVWVKENITDQFINTRIFYAKATPERHTQGCHSDLSRDFALIYAARKGGPNATLTFWQEQGEELVRERGVRRFDNSVLRVVEEYCPSEQELENTWCLVNTRILHGIVGMNSTRINMQVSFCNYVPDNILYA